MPDTLKCYRCRETKPVEEYSSPTSAYCLTCWAWLTDHGRRAGAWATETIDTARGVGLGPFTV